MHNIEISEKEIQEIINLDKDDLDEENKIDIDEDDNIKINNQKLNQYKGTTRLDRLEMKLEHMYEYIYDELNPKVKDMIKSINKLKDLQKMEWDKKIIKPILEELLIENSEQIVDIIIDKIEKRKNLKFGNLQSNKNENTINNDEEWEEDCNKIKRKNFLYISTNKKEMDELYKYYKVKNNILEMKYSESVGLEKKYYILGRFVNPVYIETKYYESINLIDEGRNYRRSLEKYIFPNKLIAEYPEKGNK